jgi:hypothetical protein
VVAEDVGLLGEHGPDVGIELHGEHYDGDADKEGGGVADNLRRNKGLSLQTLQHCSCFAPLTPHNYYLLSIIY